MRPVWRAGELSLWGAGICRPGLFANWKDKDMADLVVFLTALGVAIVVWLIQRALLEDKRTRR